MVKLTFYGGVNEIGGNKILLEDKGTKIFLDFGQSFTFGAEFFTSWHERTLQRKRHRRPSHEQLVRPLQNALSSSSCFRTYE
jgi:mRNA degradation ribonuclease J1/J2